MNNSTELGRTTADLLSLSTAPTGGILLCGWVQAKTLGAKGVLDILASDASWYGSLNLTFGTTTTGVFHGLGTSTFDVCTFSDTVTVGQASGWVFIAVQIIPGATTTVNVWRIYGPSGAVVGPVSGTFASSGQNAGYSIIPSQYSSGNVYVDRWRLYAMASPPSNAALLAIAQNTSGDTAAYFDWSCEWVSGASNVTDQSGHGHNGTLTGGSWQGVATPFNSQPQSQASFLWRLVSPFVGTVDLPQNNGQSPAFSHPLSPDPLPLFPPTVNDIPTDSSQFSVIPVVSRSSGVAPLYVHFDATSVLPAGDGYADLDATYLWSFDTTGVDGSTRYNRVSGFVAGHVFNLPGTYTVRLDVFDAAGRHGYGTTTITVSAISGTTYYVSALGNDSNNGSQSAPFLTFAHALTLAGPNVSILLRNGDVFTTPTMHNLTVTGPLLITGYSDPSHPSTIIPEIHYTAFDSDYYVFSFDTSSSDCRLVGVRISSAGNTYSTGHRYPGGVALQGSNNLLSRCDLYNLGGGAAPMSGDTDCIYECEWHQYTGMGCWSTGTDVTNRRNSLIGNYAHDLASDVPSHCYRVQGGSKTFIGFNVFEADHAESAYQIRGNTYYYVLYGNVMDLSMGLHPQNGKSPPVELIHHVVVDSNISIGRTPDASYFVNPKALGIAIGGNDIVVRNNVWWDMQVAISLEDDTPNTGLAYRVRIHSNTTITITTGDTFVISPGAGSFETKNNLQYSVAPSSDSNDKFQFVTVLPWGTSDYNLMFGVVWSESSTQLFNAMSYDAWRASTGNPDAHSQFTDPLISVTNPVTPNFAIPSSSSPARGAGIFLGNKLDARGRIRNTAPTIGAIEA